MKLLATLLCKLGIHGPDFFGFDKNKRNMKIDVGHRQCHYCKTEWLGYEVSDHKHRIIAWHKVEK